MLTIDIILYLLGVAVSLLIIALNGNDTAEKQFLNILGVVFIGMLLFIIPYVIKIIITLQNYQDKTQAFLTSLFMLFLFVYGSYKYVSGD